MCHTGPLSSVLFSELIAKNIFEFKADVLARQVVLPFVAARGREWKYRAAGYVGSLEIFDEEGVCDGVPISHREGSWSDFGKSTSPWDDRLFLAGFGNKITDAMAYEMAGMDRRDIYIINKESRILCMHDSKDLFEEDLETTERSFDPSVSDSGQSRVYSSIECDSADWSFTDVCCGGATGQVLSHLPRLQLSHNLPQDVDAENATYSAPNDATALSHDIELCLSDEQLPSSSVNVLVAPESTAPEGDPLKRIPLNHAPKKSLIPVKHAIRAFTSKKTFEKFPSFGSNSSGGNKPSHSEIYNGYDDPRLLQAVRERILGIYSV